MTFGLRLALAPLAGLGSGLALAAPWDGQPRWWLHIAAMAVLGWLVRRAQTSPQPLRQCTLSCAAYALAWICGSVWWLFISMHRFGGLPAPLAALAVLALSAFLSLYYAAVGAVFSRFRHVSQTLAAIVFAALWTLAELARGTWLTGFPWGAGGYTQLDGPLAGYAPWLGVYGVGAIAAWLGFNLHLLYAGRWPQRLTQGLLMAAVLALPTMVLRVSGEPGRAAGALELALLQGNIAQGEKFDSSRGVPQALAWYGEQLLASPSALTVAPETAIPLLPQQLTPEYLERLMQRFGDGGRAALIGIPLGSVATGYTNSVLGLQPGRAPYRYDKHHLVPFGEFIPPLFRWFTDALNIPLGDFARGALAQPSFAWAGQRLAPNICYEDLFGEELAAQFAQPETAPTILVNFSNLAWFGDSVALDQHLHISRMRALELARPMVRATNTGATAVIDHQGQVLQRAPYRERVVLKAEVQGREGLTFYATWAGRFGLAPLVGLLFAIVLVAAFARPMRGNR